jgi:threonine dehydrogenase-like Zn-dependent dehydrogenase
MSHLMRVLVFTGPGTMELQDVARPRAGTDDGVLIGVRAAGICGSELHGFRHVGLRKPPLIMGHEFAGTTPDGRRVVVKPGALEDSQRVFMALAEGAAEPVKAVIVL